MKVNVFNKDDFSDVKDLFYNVFSSEPWNDKWESDEQLTLYLNELINNQNSLTLVLKDENDKVIGASLGYVFNWWQGQEYFIKELFISNKMQNQGLGSLFLSKINDYLKMNNIVNICLFTEENFPAFDFYKKNGFEKLQNTVFLVKSTN